MTPEVITHYWMNAGPSRWFAKDASFDAALAIRFGAALRNAREGAFAVWEETPAGALGLVILLDQVSRNVHRGSALAFAGDQRALAIAKSAVGRGFHQALPPLLAQWFVMPFEHAEDLDCQQRAVSLFTSMGLADMAHWAQVHLDIIARFGRFPHRNALLGRPSTPEETAFLKAGGFSG